MQKVICRLVVLALALVCVPAAATIVTKLTNNDPAPLINSSFPYAYLHDAEKDYLSGDRASNEPNGVSLSITPFFQRANKGSNKDRKKIGQLGDIAGRWNVLALLPFGTFTGSGDTPGSGTFAADGNDVPTGQTTPTGLTTIASQMLACIDSITTSSADLNSIESTLNLQSDTNQLFGWLSVETKYRKEGIRFELAGMLTKGFGFSVHTGLAHITNVANFIDPTAPGTQLNADGSISFSTSNLTAKTDSSVTGTSQSQYYIPTAAGQINPFANDAQAVSATDNTANETVDADDWRGIVSCIHRTMLQFDPTILKAFNLKADDFADSSIEDLHGEAFWRHAIKINQNRKDDDWPQCSLIPFLALGYTLGIAKEKDQNHLLAVPFGNNGHNALDATAGISFDFYDSVELGMAGGGTGFYKRIIDNHRVPNNDFQNIIYPYQTAVEVTPGNNWHVSAFMNSRHFEDHLSLHVEYSYITHDQDKFKLMTPSTIFRTTQLENNSSWSTQQVSGGLLFNISPGCSVGISGQTSFGGRNSYAASTIAISLEFVH